MLNTKPPHYRKTDLTPRQREVLALVAKGMTNAEIADRLDITLDGAKYHVSEVIGRLNVDSREEAADWWREQNSVSHRLRALLALPALKWAAAGIAAAGVGVAAVVVLAVPQDDTPAPLATTTTPAPVAVAESWGQGVPLSDGLRWAFITGDVGNREVVMGSESEPNRVIGPSGGYATPALSPDGRWLAVTDSDDTEDFIHVLDTVSGQGLRLAIPGRYPGPPEWSGNSQRVAVATVDGLFIVDTAGMGHYTDQSWPSYTRPFTWSPDGQHVAVSTEEGFFILDGTGNRVALHSSTHGHPLDGECIGLSTWRSNVGRQEKPGEYPWSPDSQRVVASMGTALVILGVDGSQFEVATLPTGNQGHLRQWSGDSIVTEGGLYSESPAGGWHRTSPYTPRVWVEPSYTDEEEQVLDLFGDSPENVIRADVLGVDGGSVVLSRQGSEILAGAYTNSEQGEVRLLDVPDRMATLWDDWHGGGRSASFVLVGAPAVVLVP